MSQTERNTFLGLILLQASGLRPQAVEGNPLKGKVPLYPDANGAHACLCFPRAVRRADTACSRSQEAIDDQGPVDRTRAACLPTTRDPAQLMLIPWRSRNLFSVFKDPGL